MQQKPKTTVKAKVKVKAKPAAKKPVTKATNKALRKEVIGKLKEKVVATQAPKMADGTKKVKSTMGKTERKQPAFKVETKTVKPIAMVETKEVSKTTGKPIKGTEKKKAIYNTMAKGSKKVKC